MRLGSTYLLLLCLFFFKGYSCVPSGEHKISYGSSSAQDVQNKNYDQFNIQQNAAAMLQDDLFIDDNDDDDPESPRKKGLVYGSYSTPDNILSIYYFSNSFKKDQWLNKSFFYSPDKNIFLRVMKL